MLINAVVLALELESLQVRLGQVAPKAVLVRRLTMQFELLVDTMVMILKSTMGKDSLEELEMISNGDMTLTKD